MLETSLEACQDNDKIKCNAARTIGSILKLITKENLETVVWMNLFEKSIDHLNQNLLKCANVKVKWNCCYAIGSLMKNSIFFEDRYRHKWQHVIFPSLCQTIKNSENFKVRINATVSVTAPRTRFEFGSYFIEVWSTLLYALEQSNHLQDFNEYKHRDNLQEQLCASISHLINLMKHEDAIAMKNELFPLMDITKQNWNRVLNRLVPENSASIISASAKLTELELSAKNSEQKNAISIVNCCFKPIELEI